MEKATKRCGTCCRELPLSNFAVRRASADSLQGSCRECNSAWAAAHRPRKLAMAPPIAAGEKWCRECERVKPLDNFARHATSRDGRQSYCRDCFALRYRAKQVAAGKLVRPANVPDDHKFCRTCRMVKPRTEFGIRRASPDGLMSACRPCRSLVGRRDHLRRSYDLSEGDVDALREAQDGKCAICRTAPAVHVDHDHVTGKVRGMLCFSCNAALGHFRDDPAVLRRAADYLDRQTGAQPAASSRRDEAAWAEVLATASRRPSLLEDMFRARLAERSGGPTA